MDRTQEREGAQGKWPDVIAVHELQSQLMLAIFGWLSHSEPL